MAVEVTVRTGTSAVSVVVGVRVGGGGGRRGGVSGLIILIQAVKQKASLDSQAVNVLSGTAQFNVEHIIVIFNVSYPFLQVLVLALVFDVIGCGGLGVGFAGSGVGCIGAISCRRCVVVCGGGCRGGGGVLALG